MSPKQSSIAAWTRRSIRNEQPRSKSLIITLFGDSLLPYVSGVWLSELIELLKPFNVNGQLARTSSFRLTEEGWLQSQRKGRSSWYSLTPSGHQRIEHAYHRIYAAPAPEWDGNWTLVISGKELENADARADLRRELEWEGFGRLASKLFLHPRANLESLQEMLERLGVADDVVLLRARDLDGFLPKSVSTLTAECWNLERVAEHYQAFVQRFATVLPLLEDSPAPEEAFVLQTLLAHAFRRVVLHDPRLPAVLLPTNWPGHAAYELCRKVYRKTYAPVREYLGEHLQGAQVGVLTSRPEFLRRLGGLL